MRLAAATILATATGLAISQGLCLRPSTDPIIHCIVQSANIGALGVCAAAIELFNNDVDDWQQCQLEGIDKEYRERRTAALARSSEMKNRVAELLAVRARQR